MKNLAPTVGLSSVAGIVAALAAGVPAIIKLLDGVKTTQQAIVVCAALLVAAIVIVALIFSRGRQAVALVNANPSGARE